MIFLRIILSKMILKQINKGLTCTLNEIPLRIIAYGDEPYRYHNEV
ncbi:hypothetical protein ABIC60_004724 [Phyllobacterium ifriqiyense]